MSNQTSVVYIVTRSPDGELFIPLGYRTKHWEKKNGVAAGKLEKGETFAQAAMRETCEEMHGLIIQEENLVPILKDVDTWEDKTFTAQIYATFVPWQALENRVFGKRDVDSSGMAGWHPASVSIVEEHAHNDEMAFNTGKIFLTHREKILSVAPSV